VAAIRGIDHADSRMVVQKGWFLWATKLDVWVAEMKRWTEPCSLVFPRGTPLGNRRRRGIERESLRQGFPGPSGSMGIEGDCSPVET